MTNKFYICNGKELNSIEDLFEELKTMDKDTFSHHVNEYKNDFYNWIEFEIKDKSLAKKISKVEDIDKMIKILDKKINNETKKKKNIISQIKEAIINE